MRMVTPNVPEPRVTDRFLRLRVEKALESSGRPRAEVEEEIQKRKTKLKMAQPASRKTPARFPIHSQYKEQE